MLLVMPEATVMGFDYGERWTGVAIGDCGPRMAHPLTTIDARADRDRMRSIADLVRDWQPAEFVVGMPTRDDGLDHALAATVRLFGAALETQFGRPVHYVDERLSSAAAAESLRAAGRGGRADKHLTHPLAAQHILQDWLDAYLAPDIPDDHSARR